MPKAIKKKATKPVRTEEDVQSFLQSTKELLGKKQKILVPLLAAAIIAALALSGFFIYRSNMQTKAGALEYEAYKTYYGLYQKQPPQKGEQIEKALEKFKNAYEMRKSPLSLFYIASCYYDMGRYDEALKTLKELNERFPDDERYVPLAYYKMAMIDLKKGDRDGALNLLNVIYNYKTGSFKDLALIESARILDGLGRKEESTKKYEELTKSFPASPFVDEARAKLGEKKS